MSRDDSAESGHASAEGSVTSLQSSALGLAAVRVETRSDLEALYAQIWSHCYRAAHARGRTQLEALAPPALDGLLGKPLSKVLSKLLTPFETQELGGFAVRQRYTRAGASAHLRRRICAFDGLTLGIEASLASCVTDIPQFCRSNHQQEAVVYSPDGVLHPAVECSDPRRLTWNRYTRAGRADLFLFHSESGTMDPAKAGPNRSLFFRVLRGDAGPPSYHPHTQVSFWDVNVDMTGSKTVPAIPDEPTTHELALDHTRTHPVQFILPAVRVHKCRVACRPFANNQIHKGGIEQQAESMVAVAPAHWSVEALDEQGIFVFRGGHIYRLRPGVAPEEIPTPDQMQWHDHPAFSPAVFLDHAPIAVRLNDQSYQFWNFMDICSSKGVGAAWYERPALAAAARVGDVARRAQSVRRRRVRRRVAAAARRARRDPRPQLHRPGQRHRPRRRRRRGHHL